MPHFTLRLTHKRRVVPSLLALAALALIVSACGAAATPTAAPPIRNQFSEVALASALTTAPAAVGQARGCRVEFGRERFHFQRQRVVTFKFGVLRIHGQLHGFSGSYPKMQV